MDIRCHHFSHHVDKIIHDTDKCKLKGRCIYENRNFPLISDNISHGLRGLRGTDLELAESTLDGFFAKIFLAILPLSVVYSQVQH
jgi:hypothetical protein